MNDVVSKPILVLSQLLTVLGKLCGWLLLLLVIVQFCVVMGRYVFAANFLWAQELAMYLHATIIMCAAAWTLLSNRHVRIDVFSNSLGSSGRRIVEIIGSFCFLFPMMIVVLCSSGNYVVQSWSVIEGSTELSGLPGLFLIKSLIPVFAILMLCAGMVRLFRRSIP